MRNLQKDVGMTGGLCTLWWELYLGRIRTAFFRLQVTVFTASFLEDLQLLQLPLDMKYQLCPQAPPPLFHQCYVTEIKNTSPVLGENPTNPRKEQMLYERLKIFSWARLDCEMVKTNLYSRKKQLSHHLPTEWSLFPQIRHCLWI